jgi:hypothetical protein
MSETVTGGHTTSGSTKTTLLVSLCSISAILANQLKDEAYRQIAVAASPTVGLAVHRIIQQIGREINHFRICRVIKGWIKDLEAEKRHPGVSQARIREIDKEIKGHKQLLQKKQLDNIEIQ